jgi:transposase-like protein
MTRKRLTPDERDRIVELKLNRVPVRAIAEQVGTTTTTVQKTWNVYIKETASERAEKMAETREELILRQERIATDARHGAMRARRDENPSAETRYLAEERAALREIARLTGSDAPTKIEQTGAGFHVLVIKEEPGEHEATPHGGDVS